MLNGCINRNTVSQPEIGTLLHKIDHKWIVWILRSLKLKRPNIRWTLLTLCFKAYLAQ